MKLLVFLALVAFTAAAPLVKRQTEAEQELFNSFDEDGDGKVTCDEAETMVSPIIEQAFSQAPASVAPYLKQMRAQIEEKLTAALEACPEQFPDGVTLAELTAIIQSLHPQKRSAEEQTIDELFAAADDNGDGYLCLEELQHVFEYVKDAALKIATEQGVDLAAFAPILESKIQEVAAEVEQHIPEEGVTLEQIKSEMPSCEEIEQIVVSMIEESNGSESSESSCESEESGSAAYEEESGCEESGSAAYDEESSGSESSESSCQSEDESHSCESSESSCESEESGSAEYDDASGEESGCEESGSAEYDDASGEDSGCEESGSSYDEGSSGSEESGSCEEYSGSGAY